MLRRLALKLLIAATAILAAAAGFVVAVIFLFVAAYNALVLVVPGWGAALIMAGTAVFVSLIFILMARRIARPAKAKRRERKRDDMEKMFAEFLGDNARDFAEKNAFLASLIALGAGFLAGLSPKLRDVVLRFLAA